MSRITSIIDDDDRQAIDRVLAELYISVITTSNDHGTITPAAVRMLQYANHFLRWNADASLRDPQSISSMIIPGSFVEDIAAASQTDVPKEITHLLTYSLRVSSSGNIGLSDVIYTVIYAVKSKYLQLFFATLNWTVIDTSTNTISQNLSVKPTNTGRFGSGIKLYLLEGIMVANVLYPKISYCAGLDDVPLMPKYDSKLQLVSEHFSAGQDKYRILVPGTAFSDHYLIDVKYENKFRNDRNRYQQNKGGAGSFVPAELIPIPLSEGYLKFDSAEFLQGLLSLTRTVGVDQPWIRLEIKEQEVWIPATIDRITPAGTSTSTIQ